MKEYINNDALIEHLEKELELTLRFATHYPDAFRGLFRQFNTLKSCREIVSDMPSITEAEIRAKAIDDFVENISLEISESLIWGMIADCFKYKNMSDTSDKIVDYIIETSKKIAEQLKALSAN